MKDARGICADREVPLKVTLHYDTENRPEANEMTNNGKQALMSFDETNELIDVTDEQFENDWFVWNKDGDIWKCLADEKNVRDGNAHATTKEGNE